VLPGAILWGASFPLALGAVAAPGQDPGRLVGGVYAANTVGAILGSVASGLLLVTWLGTQTSMQVLIVMSAVSALMMLAPVAAGDSSRGRMHWAPTVMLVIATAAAGLLARSVPELPRLLVAYGRYSATWVGLSNIIYADEGLNASVAVSEMSNGVRNYHNAGKVGVERAAGHAPAANARAHHASDSEDADERAGHRVRRGRHGRRRQHRPARRP
jgi:spermidine synthase